MNDNRDSVTRETTPFIQSAPSDSPSCDPAANARSLGALRLPRDDKIVSAVPVNERVLKSAALSS